MPFYIGGLIVGGLLIIWGLVLFFKSGLKAKPETTSFEIAWVDADFKIRDSQGGLYTLGLINENKSNTLVMESTVSINTMRNVQVESIELNIGERRIPSDWLSDNFYQPLALAIRFDIPFDMPRGKRTAKLRAIVDGSKYSSDPFTIQLPHKPKG